MSNNIEDFEIKIVTSADLAAAKASAQELGNISTAAKASAADQVQAGQDVEKVEKEAFTSKTQLKQAIKGLKEEFPALGHIARMALNPITLIVAGIGSAWAIWQYRVQEMTTVLSGFVLPDLSEKKAGQVKAMAQAYSDLAEALRKSAEGYNSVDAASKREDERQDKQAARNKTLLESQKNLALSKLEADKSKLKPGEYEQAKGEIEEFYEGLGVKDTEAQKKEKLQRKAKKEDDLARDAKAKLKQAAGIKVGTEEQDSQTEGDLQNQAEAAKSGKTAAKDRLKEIENFRDGLMDWQEKTVFAAKYVARYGGMPGSQAIELEKGNIRNADSVIGKYDDWMNEKPNRKLARNRRGELVAEAGKEAGEAATIHRDMWDKGGELDQFDADKKNAGAVAQNAGLGRANKAVGDLNNQAKQVADGMTKNAEAGTAVLGSVIKGQAEVRAELAEALKRLRALEGRTPRI